jgi:phospholipase/carboxylesterase
MPAWYDILEMDVGRKVDTEQLMRSAEAVHALIDREVARGIPSNRIILAGFSQGGAVILQAALSYTKPLAGALSLSSYFPTVNIIESSASNKALPILVCHGTRDPVVDESLGQKAEADLQQMGYTTQYRHYAMEHSVCMEEIQDISDWIVQRLGC